MTIQCAFTKKDSWWCCGWQNVQSFDCYLFERHCTHSKLDKWYPNTESKPEQILNIYTFNSSQWIFASVIRIQRQYAFPLWLSISPHLFSNIYTKHISLTAGASASDARWFSTILCSPHRANNIRSKTFVIVSFSLIRMLITAWSCWVMLSLAFWNN